MAIEPVNTDISYTPCAPYMAPLGRLPILGKARAEVDQMRVAIANGLNEIDVRTAAQADNHFKTCEEMAALRVQTADGRYKIYAEVDSLNQKTASETGLLDQKTVTELTQTSNYIPIGIGHNITTTVDGVVEKQKLLFAKQTDGFDRDAEQKLAKIYVDTWSVRQTTDTADVLEAGLADVNIKAILTKAKAGINA